MSFGFPEGIRERAKQIAQIHMTAYPYSGFDLRKILIISAVAVVLILILISLK